MSTNPVNPPICADYDSMGDSGRFPRKTIQKPFLSKFRKKIKSFINKKILCLGFLLLTTVMYGQNHILIGDSQTVFLAKNSTKIRRISQLAEGGIGIKQLLYKVNAYPVLTTVKSVTICIGVNDRYRDVGIARLVQLLRVKFPNARFFVVQGSWGWGGVKKMNRKDFDIYYRKWINHECIIVNPAIGFGDPHANKKVYREIMENIEKNLD
jgi:hypothetical protein